MVYEGTDAYWLGVLYTSMLYALEAIQAGRPNDAELVLRQALRSFAESSCSDTQAKEEIKRATKSERR